MNLRSATLISRSYIPNLVGLTEEQVTRLRDTFQINAVQDIAILEPDDFNVVLGDDHATFMVRKKLAVIAKFLRGGGDITATTTMHEIVAASNQPTQANGQEDGNIVRQFATSAPIKLSPNDIPEFSGDIEDQERYRTKIEAMVGQTTFKFLLSRDAANDTERERDEELFNVFKSSFHDGTAYHLITSALIDDNGNAVRPSGRKVWTQFLAWCNSGGRKDALVKRIKDDLKALKLDGDGIDGFTYVNTFITKHNELRRVGANETQTNMMSSFVDNIDDGDFSVVKELLQGILLKVDRGQEELNVKEFYDMVESRQRALNKEAEKDMEAKSRRQQAQRKRDKSPSGYSSDRSDTPSTKRINLTLPRSLFKSLSREQKTAFSKWRVATGTGTRCDDDEIAVLLKQGTKQPSSNKSPDKKRDKRSRALKIRRTEAQTSKTTSEDVQLLMKSDESASDTSDSDDDDEVTKSNLKNGKQNERKIAVNKIIRKAPAYSVHSANKFRYQVILDSGTEWSVVGGPA
jgi:hypothetical protein